MDGLLDGWFLVEWLHGWLNGWASGYMDGGVDRWMEVDEQIAGWMDRRKD